MYLAIAANSANNLFIANKKEFGQNLHNSLLTVSNIHASVIGFIPTLVFISDKFDEVTAPFEKFAKSYTGKAIEAIELIILAIVAILLNESVIVGEAEIYPLQCENASTFVQSFIMAYVSSEVKEAPATSLETLRVIAKSLGIKNTHCYRNVTKLQAAIVMAQA